MGTAEDDDARGAALFCAQMLDDLKKIAVAHRHDLLAYLIEVALEEARARAS